MNQSEKKGGAHLFFNAFWLIPHFCINLMYMRDTMHQIDSGVIISFLEAILRKFRECVEISLGLGAAAASRDVIECGFPVRKKWFSELLHD
jgi:hypothetical protein